MKALLVGGEEAPEKKRPQWEVADIFRLYGETYRRTHPLPASTQKIMYDIETCRTVKQGGHIGQCDVCGMIEISYNSCGNRHCPKCQALTKARWLEARKAELLPIGYFHTVFTLPHELNGLILNNKKQLLNLLFVSVKETLEVFAQDPQYGLVGQLGFTSVLHTWDQQLNVHFHLHCIVPSGVLAWDKSQWIGTEDDFLFPVKALGKVFRGKYLAGLKQIYQHGQLQFPNSYNSLALEQEFAELINGLYAKNWVVYSKKPFNGPQQVFDYLGRYTHRVAISNHRIKDVQEGMVLFQYRASS